MGHLSSAINRGRWGYNATIGWEWASDRGGSWTQHVKMEWCRIVEYSVYYLCVHFGG